MSTMEMQDKRKVLRDFARYMVGRYRLGYTYLALYWASVLFEQIVNNKLQEQDAVLYKKVSADRDQNKLFYKLSLYSKSTLEADTIWRYRNVLFKDYLVQHQGRLVVAEVRTLENVRARLDNFRYLRNQVMHDSSIEIADDKPDNILEFICYVWSELAPDSFNVAFEKWHKQSGLNLIETLHETTADYMVRAVDETMGVHHVRSFEGISSSDFDNLFDLRRKLSGLQTQLAVWLQQAAPELSTDILTTIDTTSGYIWMPMVSADKVRDDNRRGIYNCSVSILATPLDFRVYLDFGGWAFKEREQYYSFLESPAYEAYRKKYTGEKEYQVFDVDWFCALVNVEPLDSWVANRADALRQAREKLSANALDSRTPATWNRALHGYILSKFAIDEDKGITFDTVTSKLQPIIALYRLFKEFCQEKDN